MGPFRILARILCELTGSCRILENPVGSCIGFLPGTNNFIKRNLKKTTTTVREEHFLHSRGCSCPPPHHPCVSYGGQLSFSKCFTRAWKNIKSLYLHYLCIVMLLPKARKLYSILYVSLWTSFSPSGVERVETLLHIVSLHLVPRCTNGYLLSEP